jgi:hypothetical protein
VLKQCVLRLRTFNVDSDSQRNVLLADGTEQGAEVYQPVNTMRHYDLLQTLEVQYVSEYVRTYNISLGGHWMNTLLRSITV